MATRTLTLTPEQAAYLQQLDTAVADAAALRDVAFTMLVRGQGIIAASDPKLEGLTLTITVPD